MSRVRIFTDGACSYNPGPGAWVAIILCNESKKVLKGSTDYTTNNRMELTAIINSVKEVKEAGYEDVSIYSDSAYSINAVICGWITKWEANKWTTAKGKPVKNKDLWIELSKLLSEVKNITFIKVQGHSDDQWNNECDRIARKEVAKIKSI